MGRVVSVVGLAVVVVTGCVGGGGGAFGEAGRRAVATPVAVDPGEWHAYPVIWTRSLPGESALEIAALQVDPVTCDVVIAGTLLARARFVGASVEPFGSSDGIVVRFDGNVGTQLWVAPIAASRASRIDLVGSDSDGDTLIAGEYSGGMNGLARPLRGWPGAQPFVGRLDRDTGSVEWLANFGPLTAVEIPTTGNRRHDVRVNTLAKHRVLLALLPDGAVVATQDGKSETMLQTLEPTTLRIRWMRTDLQPMSATVDAAGRLIVAARVFSDITSEDEALPPSHLVFAFDPTDGATAWVAPIDVETPLDAHVNVVAVGDDVVAITAGWRPARNLLRERAARQTPIDFRTLDPSGDEISVDTIGESQLIGAGADDTTYAVRGSADHRELVKLGPCPVERCSLAASE